MAKTNPITPDLAAFAGLLMQDTTRLELDLPNGEPMTFEGQRVAVVIYGPSTEKYAKAKAAQSREATNRLMRAAGNKRVKVRDDDDEINAAFLEAITERFENFPFPGGAEAIYRTRGLRYINDAVFAHVGDLGNFFTGAETS